MRGDAETSSAGQIDCHADARNDRFNTGIYPRAKKTNKKYLQKQGE